LYESLWFTILPKNNDKFVLATKFVRIVVIVCFFVTWKAVLPLWIFLLTCVFNWQHGSFVLKIKCQNEPSKTHVIYSIILLKRLFYI
jgi:hypothetical protein